MKQFLNMSTATEVNTLFLQPTYYCGKQCKNCYVKQHITSDKTQIPVEVFKEFVSKFFFNKDKCWANQITLSLDTLSVNQTERDHMLDIYKIFNNLIYVSNTNDRPELHITVNDLRSLRDYYPEAVPNIDVLSITNIYNSDETALHDLQKLLGIAINWNLLVTTNVDIQLLANKINKIGQFVDHIYFLLEKVPIGSKVTESDRQNINRNNIIYKHLKKYVTTSIYNKITLDRCAQSTFDFRTTGYGCSANIFQFQIWPDGSVSGCPYAQSSNTQSGVTAQDIVNNIHEARNQYDFNKCYIVKDLL